VAALRGQLWELAPAGAQITHQFVRGEIVKIATLQEAAELEGTDRLVTARVTGRVGGTQLFTVDIGMPAVLKLPGKPVGNRWSTT
jgi:hypothetical protein